MLSDRHDLDWTREVLDLETPPHDLGPFESIVALWRDKRKGGALPAWRDFDFSDFEGWYGWLSVYDVTGRQPFDFLARLWGSELVELLGHDMTGKSPRCGDPDLGVFRGGFNEDDMTFMSRIVDTPCIARTVGAVYWQDRRRHIRYTDLFVPLSSDGTNADGILNATVRLPA